MHCAALRWKNDVTRVLKGVGEHAHQNILLRLAASFAKSKWRDRESILGSVAKGSRYHLAVTIKALPEAESLGLDPADTLDRIIFGIPHGEHADVADYLREQGLNEAADRVLALEDEPPFEYVGEFLALSLRNYARPPRGQA